MGSFRQLGAGSMGSVAQRGERVKGATGREGQRERDEMPFAELPIGSRMLALQKQRRKDGSRGLAATNDRNYGH